MKPGTDGNTDEQLQGQLRHPAVHDLANSRLRDAQVPGGRDLRKATSPHKARNLQRDIAAQGMNGIEVEGSHVGSYMQFTITFIDSV
jgi:hypothetical protein